MTLLLICAVCFLAYSNGANDNFKGVATLFGSKSTSYSEAITWATVTTFCGSVCSFLLAETLLKRFSGRGLVPDAVTDSPVFVTAVAVGAGLTVLVATLTGFPISTTHGLMGAMVGAGAASAGSAVNFVMLQKNFVAPLLLSPLLAVLTAAAIYGAFRYARKPLGIGKESCICVGKESVVVAGTSATVAHSTVTLVVDSEAACEERYTGSYCGMPTQRLVDSAHFLSAGMVSFARGLNDTPKIAALLLIVNAFEVRWGVWAVGIAMASGGLLNARRVAETMSRKITPMNRGQGLSANLATGLLVIGASRYGLPVSTTHVSVGSLLGIGVVNGSANWGTVAGVIASWVLTLPIAAVLGALAYWLLK